MSTIVLKTGWKSQIIIQFLQQFFFKIHAVYTTTLVDNFDNAFDYEEADDDDDEEKEDDDDDGDEDSDGDDDVPG